MSTLKFLPERKVVKQARRVASRFLTQGIVSQHKKLERLDQDRIARVLVCRPNHRLGNLLALTPLLAELEKLLPGAEVDVVTAGGIATELFRGYPNVARVFPLPRHAFRAPLKYIKLLSEIRKKDYDLTINTRENSSTGRLIVKLSSARHRILMSKNGSVQGHFAKGPVSLLREYINTPGNFDQNQQKFPPLDIRLSRNEIRMGNETLARIHQQSRQTDSDRTIALFTHATGKKCYNADWWQSLYKLLKEECSDYSFIEILPAHAKSNLDFAIPVFYSSNVRTLASLISATDVFVGADGGVMHLASSAKTLTIGLFSVTGPESFGPYGKRNSAIQTTDKSCQQIVKLISEKIYSAHTQGGET